MRFFNCYIEECISFIDDYNALVTCLSATRVKVS